MHMVINKQNQMYIYLSLGTGNHHDILLHIKTINCIVDKGGWPIYYIRRYLKHIPQGKEDKKRLRTLLLCGRQHIMYS